MVSKFEEDTLFYGLQNMGYSAEESLADLIDNSIEAKAKNIDIIFWEGSRESCIAIIDDGTGMNNDELNNAIKFKKNSFSNNDQVKLSKFGFGLKTASFAQCEILTIISKKKGQIAFKCVDSKLNEIETNLLNIYKKFGYFEKKFNERCSHNGTLILWEKLRDNITGKNSGDKRSHAVFFEKGKKFAEHASTHFHNFMDDVKIRFNNQEIKKWNPFDINIPGIEVLDEEKVKLDNYYVTLQAFVFPKDDTYDNEEIYNNLAGPYGWFNSQGIYLYRENRLLTHGGWFGLRLNGSNSWQKENRYEKCRITMKYDYQLDGYFKPNVQKTTSEIPAVIRKQVAEYCDKARNLCVKKRRSKPTVHELVDEKDIVKNNEKGEKELNLEHPNIQLLINKNISASKKEFIIDQINKEIKKLNNA